MRVAVDWYHERLLTNDDAAAARKYLRSRGYDSELVRQYQIGWVPEGWDALAWALKVPQKLFVDSGLGFVNKRGRLTDSFRGRVLFPIFDAQGDLRSFRCFQSQPAWRGRAPDAQLYRFVRSSSVRNLVYARLLVESAVGRNTLPRPLDALLTAV